MNNVREPRASARAKDRSPSRRHLPARPVRGNPLIGIRLTLSRVMLLQFACLGLLAGGCRLMQKPFTDELSGIPPVTTPSVEAAQAMERPRTVARREFEPMPVNWYVGAVTHGPLYFEDPLNEPPRGDDVFAWSGDDYLYLVYGPARFLINNIAFPVSAVDRPPWQVMVSDGRPSRDVTESMSHDAAPMTEENTPPFDEWIVVR